MSFLVFSCKEAKTETPVEIEDGYINATAAQFQSLEMELTVPTEQTFDVSIKTSGKIDVPPQNRAKITTFIGGYVKATKLLVGDKVTKGQALLTLESTEFIDIQKDYLEVAEQINYLKSEYDRQKTLYDEKITSQKNYLKAESEYRKTKAMYQSLKSKLMLLNINPAQVERGKITSIITLFSPISGDIVVMNANVGMFASPSDVILEIVQTDHLHLELNVFEKDILQVKEGQKINFKVPQASKEIFNAEVHLVGKSIEGNDRTINVHGHLDESVKQKLLTGMFVEAEIVTNSKKALSVPTEAIIDQEGKSFVLLLINQTQNSYKFQKILVKKGNSNEKFVEITANNLINNKTKILAKGAFDLIN